MPRTHPKRPRDFSRAAKLVIDIATGEAAIGGSPYVQITMPDGTSDQIYGFDSRDAATEWIELDRRNWLRGRRAT